MHSKHNIFQASKFLLWKRDIPNTIEPPPRTPSNHGSSNSPFYSCVLSDLTFEKSSEVCIKTRSPPASFLFLCQVTQHTTVKWTIPHWNPTFITSCKRTPPLSGRIVLCLSRPRGCPLSRGLWLFVSILSWLLLEKSKSRLVPYSLPYESLIPIAYYGKLKRDLAWTQLSLNF